MTDAEAEARQQRQLMAARDLAPRGISDPEVLAVMARIPRHAFIPEAQRGQAYDDRPLAIGCEQTISQPYMVALMTQLLMPLRGARVLEVGTGSGYQTAVLSALGAEVHSIERHAPLARGAAEVLSALGLAARLVIGDGHQGLPDAAPFDRILVACAAPEVPEALLEQLAPGGRLILPIGGQEGPQMLTRFDNGADGRIDEAEVMPVRFVPFVAEA